MHLNAMFVRVRVDRHGSEFACAPQVSYSWEGSHDLSYPWNFLTYSPCQDVAFPMVCHNNRNRRRHSGLDGHDVQAQE